MNNNQIETLMRAHLKMCLPHHPISEVYEYATLPGGKLFRPHLVWSILKDINYELFEKSNSNKLSSHSLLSSSVEFHHSYTLLHDDLPCMDDDQIRRDKPCAHLVFGEWRALLAGDGLLNISYQLLSKIKNARSNELFQFFTWATGPKGLIQGQVLDLSHEMSLNFNNTARTHELKTARLIQVAILGSAILAQTKNSNFEKKLWKYSRLLGLNFQFIDDLTELCEESISQHEQDINPWLRDFNQAKKATLHNLNQFNLISKELNLNHTNEIIKDYYKKMSQTLEKGSKNIAKHVNVSESESLPVILLIKSVC